MALILVIDQSFDSLAHLADLIHTNGHECRLACSWKMALEHLLIERFDVILCEYSIDGEDAFWFIRHLETLEILSHYIIISDDVRVKKMISQQGLPAGFCLKPIHSDDLLGQMNKPI
jgi:DNA-binding NtrC family response regulator